MFSWLNPPATEQIWLYPLRAGSALVCAWSPDVQCCLLEGVGVCVLRASCNSAKLSAFCNAWYQLSHLIPLGFIFQITWDPKVWILGESLHKASLSAFSKGWFLPRTAPKLLISCSTNLLVVCVHCFLLCWSCIRRKLLLSYPLFIQLPFCSPLL